MNYLKTAILLAVLTALFMAVGSVIGGAGGMIIAFLVALAMNGFSYWNSDKIVLRMHNAVEVDEKSAPELASIVRQLAENADLPMPRLYVLHSPQPNAFATGRNPENAALAATTGLLEILSKEEVAGVMAHELAHVKNRDTLIMTMTATIAGAISMLAQFGFWFGGSRNNNNPLGWIGVLLVVLLAPFAAMLVQMAISRSREYQADKLGAWICQRPLWLASALEKIAGAAERVPMETAEENPASAHMFIINPLSGRGVDSLFSTHPAVESRIERLEALAEEWGQLEPPGREPVRVGEARGPWERTAESAEDESRGPWG